MPLSRQTACDRKTGLTSGLRFNPASLDFFNMSIQKQGMERPGGSALANRMMGDEPMNQPASVRKTAPHLWWALAVLVTGTFITILDIFIVNVALSSIQKGLRATPAELQLFVVSYTTAYGLTLMNGARLGDLYGRRRLFLSGMGVFTAASVCCGLAPSPAWLIGARTVQGVGAALLTPQIYASIRVLFEGDARRRAFAITGAVTGLAGVVSQLAGGFLIEMGVGDSGWRLIFLVNLPIGLFALIAGRLFIVETRATGGTKLDIRGAAIGALALALLLLPVMEGRESGWPWWSTVVPFLAIPTFILFVRYEDGLARRGGTPLVDGSLFRDRRFVIGVVAVFLFYSAIASFFLSLTMFLQPGLGLSPFTAGLVFTPTAILFFTGSLAGPRIAGRIGDTALPIGATIFASGIALSTIVGAFEPNATPLLIASLMLNGLGQGLVIPLATNAILSGVRPDQAGGSSGVLVTVQVIGNVIGVTVVGVLFFSVLDRAPTPFTDTRPFVYGQAFATATLYDLAAAVLSLACFLVLSRRIARGPHWT